MPRGSPKVVQDATPLAEIARERAWNDFISSKREPNIAPVVLDSVMGHRDHQDFFCMKILFEKSCLFHGFLLSV